MTMTEVKESVLIVERKGALAWLRLNRPKVMNCLNRALLKEILEAVAAVENDPEIRVIGIIGAGTKAFCAGADLAERKTLTQGETLDYIALIQRTMRCLETSSKVVIAAINGSAWGGGFELALAADLRVMVTGAQLKLTEARLGIIPGAGGTASPARARMNANNADDRSRRREPRRDGRSEECVRAAPVSLAKLQVDRLQLPDAADLNRGRPRRGRRRAADCRRRWRRRRRR